MKVLLVSISILSIIGCASNQVRKKYDTRSAKRKAEIKSCIKEFLHEDVAPKRSHAICSDIYKRWIEE